MTIDLRSDTVTKPTAAMLEAMWQANVGDDVYGEDPTVNELEHFAAQMFGMEAGLFCPSGTMTNQIAIKVHTQPGDELICADNAHVYKYEGGGIAFNSGVQARTLSSKYGKIAAEQIKTVINADDPHFPVSRLVCLENTSNRGGGSYYRIDELLNIRSACNALGLALHLDGARLFNALVASGIDAAETGKLFNSISICLSKGLGAPVGSLLLGTEEFIKNAKRVRKVFGGGMRQSGYLAAAGLFALKNNINRLAEDHTHAQQIASTLQQQSYINGMLPVETNIVIFETTDEATANKLQQFLKEREVLANKVSATALRFVFHLDISRTQLTQLQQYLTDFKN
jgi:threonine aldolase